MLRKAVIALGMCLGFGIVAAPAVATPIAPAGIEAALPQTNVATARYYRVYYVRRRHYRRRFYRPRYYRPRYYGYRRYHYYRPRYYRPRFRFYF